MVVAGGEAQVTARADVVGMPGAAAGAAWVGGAAAPESSWAPEDPARSVSWAPPSRQSTKKGMNT